MPRTLRETAALVSLAAAPLVVPYLERVNGPLLPEQKAMLGSVLFVVGVNHRDALLDVALSLLAAPGNLLTRIVGDDDDAAGQAAPPLEPAEPPVRLPPAPLLPLAPAEPQSPPSPPRPPDPAPEPPPLLPPEPDAGDCP